jgi:hypothetical protein
MVVDRIVADIMVAWMRFRGHTWHLCLEMAASMIIPSSPPLYWRPAPRASAP